MTHATKTSVKQQIQSFKNTAMQLPHLPFANIFSTECLQQIINASPRKREHIFTPLATLKTFIFQVISADGSCRQAVSQVFSERASQGKKTNAVGTSSYCKARNDLPLTELIAAVKKTGLAFPIARIVGLVSLSTGALVSYAKGCYQGKGTGETSLLAALFKDIAINDLLLADRYYCTWAIIALLIKQGSHILVQNHAQRKPNFSDGRKLNAKDHIIRWRKPKRKPVWMSEEDYQALPCDILIREFSLNGIVYVTTLLDDKKYHKKELAKLYKERWLIELDFRSIKTNMRMEMLRCKSADMVRKEIAIHFLSYNLIRANIARAAMITKKTPRQLSFMTAVQLFNEIKLPLVLLAGNVLMYMIKNSLENMALIAIGRQKRKNQPRAIKRRPKAYPLLKKPRAEACEAMN